MNQKIIINVVFLVVSLILAVFVGQWVVTAPKEVGIGLAVVVSIITFIKLNRHVWILIPACATLGISFPWIPGDFSPSELASMYVIGCTFFLLLLRKVSLRIQFTSVEWMAMLLILMLFQAFIRNPVGIRLMGSEYVGGRPYIVVVVAILASLILASTRTDHTFIKKTFIMSLLGYMATFGIHLVASISATVASYTGILFGAYGSHSAELGPANEALDPTKAGRSSSASALAMLSSRCLVAFRNPLKALYHPFWAAVVFSAVLGAGMSGFRNVTATTIFTLVMGTYYWGKGRAVLLGCFIGVSAYITLNIVNMAVPLPANIQRSLSFLPGTWEERYLEDASSSTDWRTEMWEEALLTDRYIENKILGDGLGIRRSDFTHMVAITDARVISDEMSQERAMLAGDFHSGPVTTIKVIGYVGLFVLIIAMFVVAGRAHQLIMYSRGKPYFREVIFFCLPMVWFPLFFLFIFGSFKSSIPGFFIQVGLLRLLEINLKNNNQDSHIEA